MRHSIITVTAFNEHPSIEAFKIAVEEMRLIYKASQLCSSGIINSEELLNAIERAMKVCILGGLSVHNHFRAFYIADENRHEMQKDWRLSKLAYALLILNSDVENPIVGKLQIELLRKYNCQ
ncbi:MAG: damage-inducible protein D [Cyclobacteriaceae bacterium]